MGEKINRKSSRLDISQFHLFDCIDEGFFVIDSNLCIQYWNKGAELLFEQKSEEVLGKSWERVFGIYEDFHLEPSSGAVQNVITQEVYLPSGHKKGIRLSINPLKKADGELYNYFIIASNVNEILDMCNKAESASLAKNEFLANLSHEIRSALLGILGHCDLMNDKNIPAGCDGSIKVIENCAQQLLGLANNIINLSKIENRQIELEEKNFNLHRMLEQEILSMQPRVRAKGLIVCQNFAPDLPEWVTGDEIRIRQILSNLLTNAFKYTEKGSIKVMACRHNSENLPANSLLLQISVSDTGVGIDSSIRNTIFEPYTRAENNEYVKNSAGLGLGLAISKQLVTAMGGLIWFESENNGTKFSFIVPLKIAVCSNEGHISYPLTRQQLNVEKSNIHRILLVEDRKINRKLVKLMLEDMGYSVETAANGKECLDLLDHIYPDAILMDMQMPIMDGYAATRTIRKSNIWQDVPVIALTAYALNSDIDRCMEAGCDYYLSKPFTREDLHKVLSECSSEHLAAGSHNIAQA